MEPLTILVLPMGQVILTSARTSALPWSTSVKPGETNRMSGVILFFGIFREFSWNILVVSRSNIINTDYYSLVNPIDLTQRNRMI